MAVNPEAGARKIVTLPHPLLARVRRYRFSREIATEAEAIRRLLSEALDAAGIEGAGEEPAGGGPQLRRARAAGPRR